MREDMFAAELGLAGAKKKPDDWRTVEVVGGKKFSKKDKMNAFLSGAIICLFGATVGIAGAMRFMPYLFDSPNKKDYAPIIKNLNENISSIEGSQEALALEVKNLMEQNEMITRIIDEMLPLLASKYQESAEKASEPTPKKKEKPRVKKKIADDAPKPPSPRKKVEDQSDVNLASSEPRVSEVRLPWQVVDGSNLGINALTENRIITDDGVIKVGQSLDGMEGVVVRVSPQENMVITTSKIYIVENGGVQ